MRWWMLLILALAAVPFVPITLRFTYHHEEGPDSLSLGMRLLWFLRLDYRLRLRRDRLVDLLCLMTRRQRASLKALDWQDIMFIFMTLRPAAQYMLRATLIRRLTVAVEFGTGDAALTGLTVGAFWSAFGAGLGVAKRIFRFAPGQPRLYLTPRFDATLLRVRANCIFTFRVGHIIVAGSKLLQPILKGVSSWPVSTPSRG